ncbi:MAG: hypothetical protein WBX25_18835 [Rhodomicrobium sp.]
MCLIFAAISVRSLTLARPPRGYMIKIKLCATIDLGAKPIINLAGTEPCAIDPYRMTQLADAIDAAPGWLLGRTNVVQVTQPLADD